MTLKDIIEAEAKYIVPTYQRPPVVFTRGEGAYLFDMEGKRYLDFMSGISVTVLGHGDHRWTTAVSHQLTQLVHVSNLYHTVPHVDLARRLVMHSFADKVFFCNSGSEANEAAIKFARKWAKTHFGPQKTNLVAFSHGFHGRTLGALAATHKAKFREPFAPLMPGVSFADFNDITSAEKAINKDTCAVIVEPVQGEGGVYPATAEFLRHLRHLCDQNQALLIFDEVQCGMGRTGYLWAHQAYEVTPDIMTLAKSLAGGLPIGATLVTEAIAGAISPGDHGSTFAAGPVACVAAQVVFDTINRPEFLAQVQENGRYLRQQLQTIRSAHIQDVRGAGLLVGMEIDTAVAPLIGAAREAGVLVISAGENVLRFAPPLIITKDEINVAVATVKKCLRKTKE